MKPLLLCTAVMVLLSACAGTGGNNQVYGQISGGVETVHTR